MFADFDTICEATNVSVSEEEVSSPLHLCSEHYYATYSYCRCVGVCALCGSKSKHRAGNDKCAPLRRLPQPESINVLLDEAGNFDKCLSVESVVCNSCYLFSMRLLQQCREDVHTAEIIIGSLEAKVIDLRERMHTCMTRGEVALLEAALYLGEKMFSDHAVTFPSYNQKYVSILSKNSPNTLPSSRYQVLLCVGKEFGDLLSSSCPCKRIGRLFYRTKCDPFVMLSHALGATKSTHTKCAPTSSLQVKHVASYLNDKIHELSSSIIAKRDEMPVKSCMFDLNEFVSCVPPLFI